MEVVISTCNFDGCDLNQLLNDYKKLCESLDTKPMDFNFEKSLLPPPPPPLSLHMVLFLLLYPPPPPQVELRTDSEDTLGPQPLELGLSDRAGLGCPGRAALVFSDPDPIEFWPSHVEVLSIDGDTELPVHEGEKVSLGEHVKKRATKEEQNDTIEFWKSHVEVLSIDGVTELPVHEGEKVKKRATEGEQNDTIEFWKSHVEVLFIDGVTELPVHEGEKVKKRATEGEQNDPIEFLKSHVQVDGFSSDGVTGFSVLLFLPLSCRVANTSRKGQEKENRMSVARRLPKRMNVRLLSSWF